MHIHILESLQLEGLCVGALLYVWGRRESNMIDGVSSSFNTLREDSRGPRCEIYFFLPVRGVTWGTES